MLKQHGEFAGLDGPVMFYGVVEDRNDPLNVGRVKVRCYGWHTDNKSDLPTSMLPWAQVLVPASDGSMSGIGKSPNGLIEGTTVMGVFMDGKNAQMPLVFGAIPGISGTASGQTDKGFQDPNGVYPTEVDIPDTPKLAYDKWEEDDVTTTKTDGRVTGVATADNDEWSEPESRGGGGSSTYPKNRVYRSESGHAQEFDDTPGKERIHLFHKAGTYYELLPDGTRATHVVGDDYEVVVSNKYVNIKGSCNITIDGDSKLYVKGSLVEQVDGDYDITVAGAMTIHNDVEIIGTSTATVDHISDGISGHNHTHRDNTVGLGAGTTTVPQ